MALTLLGFCRTIPELGGRVYLSTVPASAPPGSPYALVWSKPGGRAQPYQGHAQLMTAVPCVTIYAKPGINETPAQAEILLMQIANQAALAPHFVDTHNDGVTAFRPGSMQLIVDFAPMPDKQVQGQSYLTLQFSALIWRD